MSEHNSSVELSTESSDGSGISKTVASATASEGYHAGCLNGGVASLKSNDPTVARHSKPFPSSNFQRRAIPGVCACKLVFQIS